MKLLKCFKRTLVDVGLLSVLFLMNLQLMKRQSEQSINVHQRYLANIKDKSPNVFVTVVCGGTYYDKNSSDVLKTNEVQRQIEQTVVMLKSAVSLSSEVLRFVFLTDSKELSSTLSKAIDDSFSKKIRFKFQVNFKTIWYPSSEENLQNAFKLCATERLFVPKLLKEYDSVIFLDTDIVFMEPPEHLWNEFSKFNSHQMVAMAPCLNYYDTKRNKVPYYGTSGLNAGVILFNLTRLSAFPGGFISSCMDIYHKYEDRLPLADQDILNILFSQNSTKQYVFELSCGWNFRTLVFHKGRNKCIESNEEGVSLIHGNALSFYHAGSHFEAIFKSWKNHTVGSSLIQLQKSMNSQIKKAIMHSSRRNFRLDIVLLKKFEAYVKNK